MVRKACFILCVFLLVSCGKPVIETHTTGPALKETLAPSQTAPVIIPVSPTPGKIIVVENNQDSGMGTLRQALLDAKPGDNIIFNPEVFPPNNPKTITFKSGLPTLYKGNIVIDASEAGVILDGNQAGGEWTAGFEINSMHNVIRGFQIVNFTGPGILINPSAKFNIIGGSREIGIGPYGQGNLIRETSDGVAIMGSENIILGNLIGTDTTGKEKWGNRGPGIFLEETASRNVIGPGNVIAFNGTVGGGGVEIRTMVAHANQITQNSIYDNQFPGIFYNISGTEQVFLPSKPIILDFDLVNGNINGSSSCPNCTIEIFSTDKKDGKTFEGKAVTDPDGNFSLIKGGGFSGPILTATLSSADQNTSEFSSPTHGSVRLLRFQTDNPNPRQALPGWTFNELKPNRLGETQYIGCTDVNDAASYYTNLSRLGLTWIRVNVEWYDWPEVLQTGEFSDYIINACQEKTIDLLNEKGIPMLYTLTYWDPQIKVFNNYTRFRSEDEIQRYLDFVRFIVGHFKGKIKWYSILNEPNLLNDGQRSVRVEDYITLVKQVVPVIRELDQQAKIVIGEVCPLNESGSLDYLRTIIKSDLMPLVDGIAWHSSSGLSLEYQPDYYRDNPKWLDEIVTTAENNGFKGQFFATELHWRTPETPQPIHGKPWFYSDTVSAKYYARGMIFNLAKGFITGIGHEGYDQIPEVIQVINSLAGLLAGAEPVELQVLISNPKSDFHNVTFALSDGSRLIAIWNDIKAVDYDPGVEMTITIPNTQTQMVTGIDPLYAYKQELSYTSNGNSLIVQDFLIKDYPTFILLDGYTVSP